MPTDILPPEDEGDYAVFPKIAVPAQALQQWDCAPGLPLTITPEVAGGALFRYQGGRESAVRVNTTQVVSVRPDAVLRMDYRLRKHEWDYGSRMELLVEFLNAEGKRLGLKPADSSNIVGYTSMPLSELCYPTAMDMDIDYFNYMRTPANCAGIRLLVGFAGNANSVHLKEWRLREVNPALEPWFLQPPLGKQLPYDKSPAVSDDEARRIVAARPASVSSIVRNGDLLEWHVNGEKLAPAILHNCNTGSYARVTEFRPIGYRLFTTPVFLGKPLFPDDFRQVWREDDTFDISAVETALLRVLREAPDAYIILTIMVTPNVKWLLDNPEELRLAPDGLPEILKKAHYTYRGSKEFPAAPGETWSPSFHSVKYRRDIEDVLTRLMREIDKSPLAKAIAGVYLLGGDDAQFRAPNVPENSPLALAAFRQFLREKYGTAALTGFSHWEITRGQSTLGLRFADPPTARNSSLASLVQSPRSCCGTSPGQSA
ncbi:MAG: hypothetical protein IJJ33_21025 [Victivallales bacterium]|nr:hypothetical protein [Victivallales bacterium]